MQRLSPHEQAKWRLCKGKSKIKEEIKGKFSNELLKKKCIITNRFWHFFLSSENVVRDTTTKKQLIELASSTQETGK